MEKESTFRSYHKTTGLHQMIAEIFSALISVIQWPFCLIFMGQFYVALPINLGYTFFFSLENKH